jgi:3-methylcrotonyl-CoA carboxylase alpha subunit
VFKKILIANRGEIACRVAATCRRLGVRTVAVYSDADADARHVADCDEARWLGAAAAKESYLCGQRIVDVARASGAQAIHPGYGFLSENPEFAELCDRSGLVFIGPPSKAIRAMGSKSAAKEIMTQAGVPVVPGYHGGDQEPEMLAQEASRIGYPVLIKASAGGGGKGMRRVDQPADFAAGLAAAQREALAAFGDAHMLLEKYLLEPRHIEMQVFADIQGHVVHLFERDCSVQRRHQKIIEEAPAPGLSPARRRQMGEAAVAAARAIAYVGAGTVEFIVDQRGEFYFMEMNTRLQVEHPVTEMITTQDLVEWQLRVAAGEPLPCKQEDLTISGHAIEARVYAEVPEKDFLPATGRLLHLRTPAEGSHVRVDSGVRQGDEIGIHYDPMIAKLVVWGRDRDNALRHLQEALSAYEVVGVTTNLEFLGAVAAHPAFAEGEVDTGFIDKHREQLMPGPASTDDHVLAVGCLHELLRIEQKAVDRARQSTDPYSPWHGTGGWRLNDDNHHTLHLRDDSETFVVRAHFRPDHFLLELPGKAVRAAGRLHEAGSLRVDLDGSCFSARVVRVGDELSIFSEGRSYRLSLHNPLAAAMEAEEAPGALVSPMPGTIVEVKVAPGERVSAGQPLIVLEAMKMEHTVRSTGDGVVERIHFEAGEQVEEGIELLVISEMQPEGPAES